MSTKSDNIVSRFAYKVFIDGLSGMALGLFSTLIVGTILAQIGTLLGGSVGKTVISIANVAKGLTGAGIAVGVAYKFKESPLVTISAAVAGLAGAFASSILSGAAFAGGALTLKGPGEPLGAFIAAFIGIELGHLVGEGKIHGGRLLGLVGDGGKHEVAGLVVIIIGLVHGHRERSPG